MATWVRWTLGIVILLFVSLGMVIQVGFSLWRDQTAQLVKTLHQSQLEQKPKTVSFEKLDQLPEPVATYFHHVLKEGQPVIRSARIKTQGEFRVGTSENTWRPFEAVQHFAAQTPGFVWNAEINMAPLLNVHVRDACVNGKGSMQAKLLYLIPVVDAVESPELTAGALQRYLAEAVWFPTALLPDERLTWEPIDSSRARATLTHAGTTVSMEFRFNNRGEITEAFTPARYREVNGTYETAPWLGRFDACEEKSGIRVPGGGEVEWQLPDGNLPYWKGRIVGIEYELAK